MKKCEDCGETKPLSEFRKNRALKDGHMGACKDCRVRQRREKEAEERRGEKKKPKTDATAENGGETGSPAGGVAERKSETSKKSKKCERCEKRKPLSSFRVNTNTPDGRTNACLTCLKALSSREEEDQPAGSTEPAAEAKTPAPAKKEISKKNGAVARHCASGAGCVHAPGIGGPVRLPDARKGALCYACESREARPVGL